MPQSETRTCQNCQRDFQVTGYDKEFCKSLEAPLPTWCPNCRLQRRLSFRNEQNLYKRTCDAPGHSEQLISNYSDDKKVVVYDQEYWRSDNWDPMGYGQDYDFSRPFFEQFKELLAVVPFQSLVNFNNVNSEYCNFTADNKNCYLVFGGDYNEDCLYSTFNFQCKNSMDEYWSEKSASSYQSIDSTGLYKSFYCQLSGDCTDCWFLYDCKNLNNCLGCVGLKNKSFCILNKQYSKEEYAQKKQELKLHTRSGLEAFQKQFNELKMRMPRRFATILRSENSIGENLIEVKNCLNCFDVSGPAENIKDAYTVAFNVKDCLSINHMGHGIERVFDTFALWGPSNNIKHSFLGGVSFDVQYSMNFTSCNNIFGCLGLKNKSYCILNKQYGKEEYTELTQKIIEQMKELPYIDKKGREYKYGEFFPAEISPLDYNETIAYELFPMRKEEAVENGLGWKEKSIKDNKATLESIPDDIHDVEDGILKETLPCAHKGECADNCTIAFRVTSAELQFYKSLSLPVPDLCYKCRHYQRLKLRNPMNLWHRQCQCAGESSDNRKYKNTITHSHAQDHCPNEFETPYAPNRPEIVYCEQCYQQEVV
ncbi:MAG: hypothetical protein COU11_02850 [Candidatus Harrisonbacteria bacterium CG10_big_fil_rev_8_21_14_0_10_49_15]|uniref:Uncharacterized protein n=1 Tax=Candidatus Harrisonbacteria bacterium CG10_big_fil_rev_8_21_14_0_10_49_15 TaxID=1974587 RepID=A0A2H0UKK0_9BACT|nr:MAG: hypothetical protein COU11_02850 [Candidatus Harrisonbacteria bacterium CG10_big_fil_rev_8_21_14_0_10_49_15]